MTISEILAEYLSALSYDDLPQKVVREAKREILDTIGAGIAGVRTEEAERAFAAVKEFDQMSDCTVWGSAAEASAPTAALLNGVSSHALELDDTSSTAHPGAVLVPAAAAIGEHCKASGKDFITAIVAGYEICERICDGLLGTEQYKRGWHPTGTAGSFGAAVVAGKILRLDKMSLTWAIGLAGTYTGGIFAFLADGAMSKRLHPGRAAETGVVAAFLASHGFTGPTQIIEADYGGFFKTYQPGAFDYGKVTENLGKSFKILTNIYKPYAQCRCTHGALDAIIALRSKYNLRMEDVDAINVKHDEMSLKMVAPKPIRTLVDATMSSQFGITMALMNGKMLAGELSMRNDPKIGGFLKKIHLESDSTLDPTYSPAIVEVRTIDGRKYSVRVDIPKGDPRNPLTDNEIKTKFRDLASTVLPLEKVSAIERRVDELENITNIEELFALCRP